MPGIDYMEKFAPVACDATTKVILALTLYKQDERWTCETIDVEVAFLESPIEKPTFMELPPGTVELNHITKKGKSLPHVCLESVDMFL